MVINYTWYLFVSNDQLDTNRNLKGTTAVDQSRPVSNGKNAVSRASNMQTDILQWDKSPLTQKGVS